MQSEHRGVPRKACRRTECRRNSQIMGMIKPPSDFGGGVFHSSKSLHGMSYPSDFCRGRFHFFGGSEPTFQQETCRESCAAHPAAVELCSKPYPAGSGECITLNIDAQS